MKRNVTLKLDTELLKEARVLAAEQGSSISRLLAEKLEEVVRERAGYDRARKRALARLRVGMNLGWTRPGSRDESLCATRPRYWGTANSCKTDRRTP